ncbi:MAG: T9SS type A sorting domain-containing protein [Bacteroidetes bacterium]|nr:T9SS type A sorting domain-containing protein [Bacteroidota bacterium]
MKKLILFLGIQFCMNLQAQVTPLVTAGDSTGSLIEFKNRQYLFVYGAYPAIIVTDGTTNPVKPVISLPNGSFVSSINKTANLLFIYINNGALYVTDGSNEVLTQIATIPNEYIGLATNLKRHNNIFTKEIPTNYIGNKIIFGSRIPTSTTTSSIWVSDGTSAGTMKLTSATGNQLDVLFDTFGNNIGGFVYFNAKELGATEPYYLWKTDGTIGGTNPVLDNLGQKLYTKTKSNIESINNELVFIANTDASAIQGDLYKTNGSSGGTLKLFTNPKLPDSQNSDQKMIGWTFKNKFYFYGNDNTLGDYYLYETDGSIAGTKLVKNMGDNNLNIKVPIATSIFIDDGNYLYFTGKGRKFLTPTFSTPWDFLFATDGTTTKTIDVIENFPTISSYFKTSNGIIGNRGNNSIRLNGWIKPVKTSFTINELNPDNSLGGSLFIHKNKIFFAASQGGANSDLWVSDGTQLGTKMFAEVGPGTLSGDIKYFFEINNHLYFFGRQGPTAPYYIYKLEEDYTFNGQLSSNLSLPQNWNSGSLPTSVDNATIPSGFSPILNGNFAANNLILNSPTQLASGNMNISGNLNLGAKLSLNNNNLILKGSSSLISNGNSSNYIETNGSGKVTVENMDANRGTLQLPIGTSTQYNPVSLKNTGAIDNFSVQVSDGISNTSNEAVNATWDISEATAGGSTLEIGLGWNQAQESAGFNRANAKVGHFVGGVWTEETSGSVSGSNPYFLIGTGITSLSPFSVMNFSSLATSEVNKKEILIYPNPIKDLLNIQVNEDCQMTIYDLSGKHISTESLKKDMNTLDKSHLTKGVYELIIQGTKTLKSFKIIKN